MLTFVSNENKNKPVSKKNVTVDSTCTKAKTGIQDSELKLVFFLNQKSNLTDYVGTCIYPCDTISFIQLLMN